MYGKAKVIRAPVRSTRSSPYGEGSESADPVQQAAVEQLLQTIADRASQMNTKDILQLSAVFAAVSGDNSTRAPAPAQARGGRSSSAAGSRGVQNMSPYVGNREEYHDAQVENMSGYAPAGSNWDQNDGYPPNDGYSAMGDPLPALQEVIGDLKTVKVSAKTNVKSIAGAMSKTLRNSEALVATAVGPEGVNHGMKALSITRCYLAAEGLDLTATVTEVQRDEGINTGRCYAFTVMRMVVPAKTGPLVAAGVGRIEPQTRIVRPPGQQTDLKVSGQGGAASVGGAIAKCLREDREVVITAVGPSAVAKCVEALALARNYVRTDGIELVFYPGFETIVMQGEGPGQGEQRSCVRVHVWPELTA